MKGQVVDSTTKQALFGAYVFLLDKDGKTTSKGTTTDYMGNFNLNVVDSGTNEYQISYIGYKTKKTKQNSYGDYTLDPDVFEIKEVEIKGVRTSKPKEFKEKYKYLIIAAWTVSLIGAVAWIYKQTREL